MRKPFDAEAHLEHMREMMELAIQPEWQGAVAANLATIAAMAAKVLEFQMDDHVEAAPVFEA